MWRTLEITTDNYLYCKPIYIQRYLWLAKYVPVMEGLFFKGHFFIAAFCCDVVQSREFSRSSTNSIEKGRITNALSVLSQFFSRVEKCSSTKLSSFKTQSEDKPRTNFYRPFSLFLFNNVNLLPFFKRVLPFPFSSFLLFSRVLLHMPLFSSQRYRTSFTGTFTMPDA